MSTIIPIPTSRVSDALVNQRLVNQLDADEVNLTQLQTEVSTGQSMVLPSDNPTAAENGLELMQQIAQNTQYQSNVSSSQSYLTATDSAMSSIGNLLNTAQSTAESAIGTTATSTEQQTAADEIGQIISQLVDIGNQTIQGRYLFSGSQSSVQPFTYNGSYVQYNGNESSLNAYSDVNQLFATNVNGNSVFGTLSTGVQGTANLTPVLTASTQLSGLNGGQGIAKGSIAVSNGSSTSIVDLSGAQTVGDVVQLIEANPPAGSQVNVSITSTGLDVSLAGGSGNLAIQEVGSGTTASDLGILQATGNGPGPIVGSDLNPQLTLTTPLNDILGTNASAEVTSAGANNDLVFQSQTVGAGLNGVTVSFVDNPAITEGNESVSFNSSADTLVFQVAPGKTTANDIINAVKNSPAISSLFNVSLSPQDTSSSTAAGTGVVDASATATLSGGSGTPFDTTGIQIDSGGQAYNISFAGAQTIQDVINAINGSKAGVVASINSQGNGIDIQSRLSGADFSIGEDGGTTAAQLGVLTLTTSTPLSELNHGQGVQSLGAGIDDFTIDRPDGTSFGVSVASAQTIGDVINLINNDPANQASANKVTAQLSTNGNGIVLSTANGPGDTGQLQVVAASGGTAAQQLGLIPSGATQSSAGTVSGGQITLQGTDPNPGQVDGVFNTLVRLQSDLETNNTTGIQNDLAALSSNQNQLNLVHSTLGEQEQSLSNIQSQLTSTATSLQSSLSQNVDVDMASVISELTEAQTSMEASLQTTALVSKMTLLNYL
ncbi:MAG TPA: flagellar hook-associated protein FlgL [Pirellulales bacterium]|jgi:flagellin-like hook-associated protein FlgL|nr:flagellar hook-associated protein FlgL [Pirellulales bacterium]